MWYNDTFLECRNKKHEVKIQQTYGFSLGQYWNIFEYFTMRGIFYMDSIYDRASTSSMTLWLSKGEISWLGAPKSLLRTSSEGFSLSNCGPLEWLSMIYICGNPRVSVCVWNSGYLGQFSTLKFYLQVRKVQQDYWDSDIDRICTLTLKLGKRFGRSLAVISSGNGAQLWMSWQMSTWESHLTKLSNKTHPRSHLLWFDMWHVIIF